MRDRVMEPSSNNTIDTKRRIEILGSEYDYYSIDAFEKAKGVSFSRLPFREGRRPKPS